jgi:glycosyltransferase involved in cell wall biosynthesis
MINVDRLTEDVEYKIGVVIPCFNVKDQIVEVLTAIPDYVDVIVLIDDACPQETGKFVSESFTDTRMQIVFHETNLGVGGAVKTGYEISLRNSCDIVVKVDGDGQMNPLDIEKLIFPIVKGKADYSKGNRFADFKALRNMPNVRILGNAILSFLTKLSSGYHNIFDPNNGFTAIHADVLRQLDLSRVSDSYFFESDMLFGLYSIRAVVQDVPLPAKYDDEKSNLKILKIIPLFLRKHFRNIVRRIFETYYIRDFSIASVELPLGAILFLGGIISGTLNWWQSKGTGVPTPVSALLFITITIVTGTQLLLNFLNSDVQNVPKEPVLRDL